MKRLCVFRGEKTEKAMKKNKQKHVEAAKESLSEILKEIEPYLPKTPKVKQEPHREWKLVIKGELPPLNSV